MSSPQSVQEFICQMLQDSSVCPTDSVESIEEWLRIGTGRIEDAVPMRESAEIMSQLPYGDHQDNAFSPIASTSSDSSDFYFYLDTPASSEMFQIAPPNSTDSAENMPYLDVKPSIHHEFPNQIQNSQQCFIDSSAVSLNVDNTYVEPYPELDGQFATTEPECSDSEALHSPYSAPHLKSYQGRINFDVVDVKPFNGIRMPLQTLPNGTNNFQISPCFALPPSSNSFPSTYGMLDQKPTITTQMIYETEVADPYSPTSIASLPTMLDTEWNNEDASSRIYSFSQPMYDVTTDYSPSERSLSNILERSFSQPIPLSTNNRTSRTNGKYQDEKICTNCSITETTMWRRNINGLRECNSCNVYEKRNGTKRPQGLWTGKIVSRRKKAKFVVYE